MQVRNTGCTHKVGNMQRPHGVELAPVSKEDRTQLSAPHRKQPQPPSGRTRLMQDGMGTAREHLNQSPATGNFQCSRSRETAVTIVLAQQHTQPLAFAAHCFAGHANKSSHQHRIDWCIYKRIYNNMPAWAMYLEMSAARNRELPLDAYIQGSAQACRELQQHTSARRHPHKPPINKPRPLQRSRHTHHPPLPGTCLTKPPA